MQSVDAAELNTYWTWKHPPPLAGVQFVSCTGVAVTGTPFVSVTKSEYVTLEQLGFARKPVKSNVAELPAVHDSLNQA